MITIRDLYIHCINLQRDSMFRVTTIEDEHMFMYAAIPQKLKEAPVITFAIHADGFCDVAVDIEEDEE